jgi:hypothetical protein
VEDVDPVEEDDIDHTDKELVRTALLYFNKYSDYNGKKK